MTPPDRDERLACPNDYLLDQKYLREHFDYHTDGYLLRIKRESTRGVLNRPLRGGKHWSGYRYFRIKGKSVSIHRAIFAWHHGFVPRELDHINRDRTDNRIENLRPSDRTHNSFNSIRANKTGIKGLIEEYRWGGFFGQVQKNGQRFVTKQFKDKAAAVKALKDLQERLYGKTYVP